MATLDVSKTREYLKAFHFTPLFIEELGWDHHTAKLELPIDGQVFILTAIAQKRGMVAYLCPSHNGQGIPDYQTRRRIEAQTAKSTHEHLIIYTDADKTTQIWQWVKREAGKPTACREHPYHRDQPGDALIQKLQGLFFSIEEEEILFLPGVIGRVRAAFDVDRITKRFYDRFKAEHDAFLKFLKGIPDEDMQRWYASVMLNRLMFIYFIQKKNFLNNNADYLRSKLRESQQRGKDLFYREFLCPLFFEGFAKNEADRADVINKLLGKVPYLNGGLFLKHQIEEFYGETIQIADTAFENIFAFFEQYQWHLDERPLRADNEINPDVLGYIFEKYINQKQMGAYYTKEDITEYISKNTIIPFLFDRAKQKCRIAFEGNHAIWQLLQADPDRYIYDAVKKGTELPLPEEIAEGLKDVSKRTEWNKAALSDYALPTENWREVVARRNRYEEVWNKLTDGASRDINDLITHNLNIRQFAQDVIENSEGPELLRAFWHAIENVTILDPTCGSGAFLFAALNILEPLYEACLNRMEVFLDELERSGEKHRPEKFSDFRKILQRVAQHPNPRYFIMKSIILNNLYGVDIMEEAIEICKLRLFLKLVAQVERVENIEPLPDIDFNIRAGNTLVGYATYENVKDAVSGKLDFDNTLEHLEEKAGDVDRLFKLFRQQQTEIGGDVTASDKEALRNRLKELEDELNQYLAGEYGADSKKNAVYKQWLASQKPFHWFIEFYGIMKSGGFDVIIGNPPYVEYSKVNDKYTVKGYKTEACGNLYAYVIERCIYVLRQNGRMGMIVQLPIVCTDRMTPLQKECLGQNSNIWFANFDDRPARLFDGLEHIRATIVISQKGATQYSLAFSTTYNRWYSEARQHLFNLLLFLEISAYLTIGAIPKIGHSLGKLVRERIGTFLPIKKHMANTTHATQVFFHNAPQYWVRAMDFAPYFWNEREGEQISTQIKTLLLPNEVDAAAVVAVLNSTLFYWWFIIHSDCRHLNIREIENFPLGLDRIPEMTKNELKALTCELMSDFESHKNRKKCQYKTTGKVVYDEYFPRYSKTIIDKIDRALAKHYGFTDEELDFIINYDIKYRMGRDNQVDV